MAHWGYIEKRLSDGKIIGWICSLELPQAREVYEWVAVEDQPVVEGKKLLVKGENIGVYESLILSI